jgi:ubiquinone/menaquinone biosynthesis C-methylase UbiE
MSPLETLLQCPITGQPLRFMDEVRLSEVNRQILAGSIACVKGQCLDQPFDAALLSANGDFLYGVLQGIHCLLADLAIAQTPEALAMAKSQFQWNDLKQNVQDFYQQIGWKKGEEDLFEDTLQFEETRPVAKDYISRCHRRLKRYIPAQGQYLLDVASGPLQFQEYLEYSETYQQRICVDLSAEALKSAQRQLGDRGIYILGDITRLPLQDGTIDGIISLHTIYHVPKDEQADAFRQLHRVLKPGGTAAVVYSWGEHAKLLQWLVFPAKLVLKGPHKLGNFLKKCLPTGQPANNGALDELVLYYHPRSPRWFQAQPWPFAYTFYCWRSINLDFMQAYIHDALGGRQLLRWIYALEERFSHWFGRYGQYPVIVISK